MRSIQKLSSTPLVLLLALALAAGLVACRADKVPPGAEDAGPAATPEAEGVDLVGAELGRAVGGDGAITDATDEFGPNDTIYVSIETVGSAPRATLAAHWTYEGGQTVDHSETTIAPTGSDHTEFHVSKPDGWPPGSYQVEITLDGEPVETLEFQVEEG